MLNLLKPLQIGTNHGQSFTLIKRNLLQKRRKNLVNRLDFGIKTHKNPLKKTLRKLFEEIRQ